MFQSGSENPRWNGGRSKTGNGYVEVLSPDHFKTMRRGYVLEHVLKVETAMEKPLPPKAEVHHVNGDPSDNRNENLVACQDRAYHTFLELRKKQIAETGSLSLKKCRRCGEIKPIVRFCKRTMSYDGLHYYCRECDNEIRKESRRKKKETGT